MNTLGNLALVIESDAAVSGEDAPASDAPFVFQGGLFGFPECHSFVLLPAPREGFFWLQSTEHEALCLLLADPFRLFRGYSVDLPKLDAAELGVAGPEDVAILVTVTLPEGNGRVGSANLQGPVALNLRTRRGRQVILNKGAWGVREAVDLA